MAEGQGPVSIERVPAPQTRSSDQQSGPVPQPTSGSLSHAGSPTLPTTVLRLQQTVGNRAVQRILLQRDSKPVDLPVDRNEVELLGARLKMQQIDLASFLGDAKKDVDNIRGYFEWVLGVYARCHGHYALVLAQAGAQADTAQKWVDFIFGVAVGVSAGLLAEAMIAGLAAEAALEVVAEVGAEIVEGGITTAVKPQVPKPVPLKGAGPEFKQIQALENLDKLNSVVLRMAIPGVMVYQDPIVQSERLIAELRVIQAGGQRRMSDDEIRESHLKLMRFSLSSLQLDARLQEAKAKFDALRVRYTGKQAPSDARCEQDIWIPWLAEQDIDTFFAPTLMNELIRRHLADIGLAGWDKPGGRLGVKVDTGETNPFSEPRPGDVLGPVDVARKLKAAAGAAKAELPTYWKDVFLG